MYNLTLLGLFTLYLCRGITGMDDNTGQEVQLAQIKAIVCALIAKGVSIDVLDKTTIHRLQRYEINLEKMSEENIKSMCDNLNSIKLKNNDGTKSTTRRPETRRDNTDLKHNVEQTADETNAEGENYEEIIEKTDQSESAPLDDHSAKGHRIIKSSLIIALNNAIFPQQNDTITPEETMRGEILINTLKERISQNKKEQIRRIENYKKSNVLTDLLLKLIDGKSNTASKIPIIDAIKSIDYTDNMLYNTAQTVSEERPKINVIIIKENDYINQATSLTTESVLKDTKYTETRETSANCKRGNYCNIYDATAMTKVIEDTFQKLIEEAAENMAEKDKKSVISERNNEKQYYKNQYSDKFISPTSNRHVNDLISTRKNHIRINNLKYDNDNSAEITNNYWNKQGRQGFIPKINDKIDFFDSKDSYSHNTKIDKSHYDRNNLPSKKHGRTYTRHMYSKSLGSEKETTGKPEINQYLDNSQKQHSYDNKHSNLLFYQDLNKEIAEMKREYLARNSRKDTIRREPNEDYSYGQNLSNEEEKLENKEDDTEKKYALDIALEKYKQRHNMKDIVEKNVRTHFQRNQKKPVENINKIDNINLNLTGLSILNEIKVMILNEIKKDMNMSRTDAGITIARTGTDLSNTTPETSKPISKPITAITTNTSFLIGTLKQDILNTIKLYLSNASNLLVNADKSSPMTNTPKSLKKQYQSEQETFKNKSATDQMPCLKTLIPDTPDSNIMLLPYIQDGSRKHPIQTLNQNGGNTIENNLETPSAISMQYQKNYETRLSNSIQKSPVSYSENTNSWQDSNSNSLKYNTNQMDSKNHNHIWGHLNPEVYRRNQLSMKNIEIEPPQSVDPHTGMSIEEFIKTQEKLNVMLEKFLASQNGLKKDDSIEIL